LPMLTKTMLTPVAALCLLAAPAVASDDMDTFEIDVVLADLAEDDSAKSFENRLKRAARRYCDGYAPGATRRAARKCESMVIAAVEEAVEERQLEIRVAEQS